MLCVDEKSQIQALDRTAPILPLLPTTPARMTHDYVRHGTTSLFAALDVASGSVIAEHHRRHRHQEFLRFLQTIDKAVPVELDLHLICDNYGTHKTPEVRKWLLRHPRFHLHFTPTSGSWLNLVERWFAELTRRKLRRSAHRSVVDLERDVRVDRRTECRRNRHRTCRPFPSSQRPVLARRVGGVQVESPQSPQATRRNDLDADERWARIISVEGSSHVCIVDDF